MTSPVSPVGLTKGGVITAIIFWVLAVWAAVAVIDSLRGPSIPIRTSQPSYYSYPPLQYESPGERPWTQNDQRRFERQLEQSRRTGLSPSFFD